VFMDKALKKSKGNIVYEHQWKPGDLVVFDNQRLLHGRNKIIEGYANRLLYRMFFDQSEFDARRVPISSDFWV
jgi:alpha-ketoglutarate-dependent taurine dioxygenase